MELDIMAAQLSKAKCPEDVFGPLVPVNEDTLKSIWKKMALVCHPDRNGNSSQAHDVFTELNVHFEEAKKRISGGKYGANLPYGHTTDVIANDVEVTLKGRYKRYASFSAGDIADLHLCNFKEGSKEIEAILKIVRAPIDNELLDAERKNLTLIHDKLKGKDWNDCIPQIYDSFFLETGMAGKRPRVNILEKFDGFYTVEQIRELMPSGVDAKSLAWMWKRLLILLDWTHHAGVIHGAVLPKHVMYYPDNDGFGLKDKRKHSVRLIDWCYSVPKTSKKLSAWIPEYADFYPPEVAAKQDLGPWTDIYMAAKTMLFLVGGNVQKNIFPASIPKEIANSLHTCLEPNFKVRPQKAGEYFNAFNGILKGLYGPPKYHPFNLPIGK